MPDSIKSGSSGNLAIVDSEGRLQTRSTMSSEFAHEAISANSYVANTGIIALTTTASYSGIFYLKNLATTNLTIYSVVYSASVVTFWQCVKQPTLGTLISAGTALKGYSTNLGSLVTLNGTVYGGADSKTVTDGTVVYDYISNIGMVQDDIKDAFIVPPNSTIAWLAKPSASGSVALGLYCYYD